jgi:Zn finger protein HypA/HybF involved in hydrogenase expression
MSHDHNGRVGCPRCEECNAPLSADDLSERLCQECQAAALSVSSNDLRNMHALYLDSIAETRGWPEDR